MSKTLRPAVSLLMQKAADGVELGLKLYGSHKPVWRGSLLPLGCEAAPSVLVQADLY